MQKVIRVRRPKCAWKSSFSYILTHFGRKLFEFLVYDMISVHPCIMTAQLKYTLAKSFAGASGGKTEEYFDDTP